MRTFVHALMLVILVGAFYGSAAQSVSDPGTPEIRDTNTPSAATLDQVIDKIIAREHYEYAILTYFHPIIETHIQDMKIHDGETAPWRQWDLRGRADIASDLTVHTSWNRNNENTDYKPVGFLQMAFIDRENFDRGHYSFRYVGQDQIAGINCFVFDVAPLPTSIAGRFRGRIWANDQDYTIVHFSGTYMPLIHWELVPTPTRENRVFASFDSWRSNAQPGIWLPSTITSERETPLREGSQRWVFNAETHFSEFGVPEIQNPKFPQYSQEAFEKPIVVRPRLGKTFWISWSVNFGLMMTANTLTARCVAAHECIEADPIFGHHPSAAEVYSVRLAAFALAFHMARKQKLRRDDTLWHYTTYMPMMLYGWDAFNDVIGTLTHSGQKIRAPSLQPAHADVMYDINPN
ncbi:MAG TPA: hypothetical protein VMG82_03930 [Candidatus Sulfotelmatobacter sp.]|nr:hypothetical protein [Candidatus Sulfotelmatobacter sp.]